MKKDLDFYIEIYPEYSDIIKFYDNVSNLQNSSNPIVNIPLNEKQNLINNYINKNLPFINKEDFIIDLDNSIELFKNLCEISKNVNDKMNKNVYLLEDAIYNKNLEIKELIENYHKESYLEFISSKFGIDLQILKFFIYTAITPSIKKNVENLINYVNVKQWLKGYCPMCGSMPIISILREEGKRYLLCSYCYFEWLTERIKCPFCENNDHNTLHYFFEEKDEIHRIDLCDRCKQYIKTIDSRKQNYEMDIIIEDIVTLHLDIIAIEKGYKKPVSNFWSL